jgi:hypothetical protein
MGQWSAFLSPTSKHSSQESQNQPFLTMPEKEIKNQIPLVLQTQQMSFKYESDYLEFSPVKHPCQLKLTGLGCGPTYLAY